MAVWYFTAVSIAVEILLCTIPEEAPTGIYEKPSVVNIVPFLLF